MARIFRLFGWEYRKPERAPPACPYKPPATKPNSNSVATESGAVASDHNQKPIPVDDSKRD
ncbi:hypothetical protein M9H77_01983 [Catharanthus roseus]|uniref:Uncharacterized protein n=1 Tax=Catharanthus roseus TaxID=4058 RepID=A0ACC0C7J5_CATRO|nr:hypothetical protein M9H77_01983 [Catharanthus roseus]